MLSLSTIVISTRQRRMGPYGHGGEGGLCRNGESNASCSLLSPVVTYRSSLFIDHTRLYFRHAGFILGDAVSLYFILKLA